MKWMPEAWENALAAMRERSSVAEILALYEGGAITACEVLQGTWSQCHDRPVLRAELVRRFRTHSGEYIADVVGLTEVELNPLGQAAGVEPAMEDALFSPPSSGALLQRLRPGLLAKLLSLDKKGVKAIGKRWSATMSTPPFTHSVTGTKISAGWSAEDAMGILEPLLELARQASDQ